MEIFSKYGDNTNLSNIYYYSLAIFEDDIKMCDNIKDNSKRLVECKAMVLNDPSICNQIN